MKPKPATDFCSFTVDDLWNLKTPTTDVRDSILLKIKNKELLDPNSYFMSWWYLPVESEGTVNGGGGKKKYFSD